MWLQGIKRKKRVMWIIDSGCSSHMTGDRALLSNLVEKVGPWVTFGDDSKGFTKGYGSLEIGNVVIENISLVDGLKHNLLSVNQFTVKGYEVNFKTEQCNIINKIDKKLALQGVRKGNLFVADLFSASKGEVRCFYNKDSTEDSWLWNKILSHLNFKTMNSLVKRELLQGFPDMEFCKEGLCEACEKGKSKKASHRSKDMTYITEPLQLLHIDLFGPVNVMSLSRKRYALVIVDDFSKYTWVLFLNSKDETPKMIIDHIKRIELEANLLVRKIRSDNGTEFKNAILNEFCTDKGISRQYSAPRTPQQNGVVERKNRTLVEAARTMLNEAKLPLYFWAKAVNTTCYTQNRTLINKDHNKTSYEIMANKKPIVKYFHVFGAKCFTLKDDEQLGKFESKAHEGIFLGYSLESKAYRVYVIDHKKVIESMNVTFDDNKLQSIQAEDNTETLKFENLILEDSDTEEPEAAEDRQENNTNNDVNEPSSGNDGGNSENTGFEMGSSSH